MKTYIGVKILQAEPCTLGDYNQRRGWTLPANEDPARPGYFLVYPDGYQSWSPKEVFDAAYRPFSGLTFGLAIEALKLGKRVARTGWNGVGMFVYLVPANSYRVQTDAAKAFFGEGSMIPYRAYLALKTQQGDVATWQPSVSDTLAEDWYVLDERGA